MARNISRRNFLKNTALAGASSIIGSNLISCLKPVRVHRSSEIDISIVAGSDYFKNTLKSVEQLGGIQRFVLKNSRVSILANPQRNNPGTYTNPEILRAVIRMCKEAGAKEINCLSWQPEKNWESTSLLKTAEQEGANLVIIDLKDETLFNPVLIPKGKVLKECRIMKPFFNHDVFINMPITKDHAGNRFTGTLKNIMGLNSPQSNRTFHKENWLTDFNSIKYLDQCIADLNTIIQPDLNIVDATEFIITNGPFGPGKILKPRQIVAGIDRVAIDSYCCQLWGLEAKEIHTIQQAFEHKIGEMNLERIVIKKTVS